MRSEEHETDICSNLMKHNKSILHLDLKPGNVLLTWDEGKLMYYLLNCHVINADEYTTRPCTMLSDFGTSRDMINSTRLQRSGNTGTLVLPFIFILSCPVLSTVVIFPFYLMRLTRNSDWNIHPQNPCPPHTRGSCSRLTQSRICGVWV